jgi:hypothetical protein
MILRIITHSTHLCVHLMTCLDFISLSCGNILLLVFMFRLISIALICLRTSWSPSRRRRRPDRRRSGTVFFRCHTLRVSRCGVYGLVRVHRDRGSSPRVSSSRRNSSYDVQAIVSRQRHLLLLHVLVLGLVVDTHS